MSVPVPFMGSGWSRNRIDWLDVYRKVDWLVENMHRMIDGHQQLERAGSDTRRRLDDALAALTALVDRVEELDRRFTEILSASLPNRGDVATKSNIEHQQNAESFRVFVDQDVLSAARAALQARKRPRNLEEETDQLVRNINQSLFGQPDPDVTSLQNELGAASAQWAATLVARSMTLRLHSDRNQVWDFAAQPGAFIDPERQEPWGRYGRSGRVTFVVAPAYVVDGRVYARQRVATSVLAEGDGLHPTMTGGRP